MYRVEGPGSRDEQHFSEGEPDLEPPEELAVDELDDDLALEEDLECELLREEDVDVQVLEQTLEQLAHAGDEIDDPDLAADEFRCRSCGLVLHRRHLAQGDATVCAPCAS